MGMWAVVLIVLDTPRPLYNTIVGVHSINCVISKQKCIDYIEK